MLRILHWGSDGILRLWTLAGRGRAARQPAAGCTAWTASVGPESGWVSSTREHERASEDRLLWSRRIRNAYAPKWRDRQRIDRKGKVRPGRPRGWHILDHELRRRDFKRLLLHQPLWALIRKWVDSGTIQIGRAICLIRHPHYLTPEDLSFVLRKRTLVRPIHRRVGRIPPSHSEGGSTTFPSSCPRTPNASGERASRTKKARRASHGLVMG